MSLLKSSLNYVWNINDVLGKGATGAVFKGTNKETGELVAVKSFNHLSHMRPYEVQKREFEVLKKVNHQNIVKLLSIEEEIETQHKVLIMELCTGGSLFNILDKPINSYGLEENEFMTVLDHLAAGMKHLRDMNIIHRDLKPGNIMKYIGVEGNSIYKLTDFGAARELQEDQQFMSLYGTEEYLHPDMYERAVLRKPAIKSFKANVDLWSIGVTLFHVATGSLPFRPYGGRKNKETMYKITTEKQSGIISGIQYTENGEIEWSRILPKTCLLSLALQLLITPLLAGLVECDSSKMWSFDKFFRAVRSILSHTLVYIFDVNKLKSNLIYLHPNENMDDLKHRIEIITSYPISSCLILFNNKQSNDLKSILGCSESNPVIILNRQSTKIKQSPLLLFKFSNFPEMPTTTNCDKDVQIAKLCSSLSYSILRIIKKSVLFYKIITDIPVQITSFIVNNIKLHFEKQSSLTYLFNSIEYQINHIGNVNGFICELNQILNQSSDEKFYFNTDSLSQCQLSFLKLSSSWSELEKKINNLNAKVRTLNEKWSQIIINGSNAKTVDTNNSNLNPIFFAETKGEYYCQKVRDSWQALHQDKCIRTLSNTEEQLHYLEKVKIENNTKCLTNVLRNTCFNALREITEDLEDWYKIGQIAIVHSELLFDEFLSFSKDWNLLQKQLTKIKEEQKTFLEYAIKKLKLMQTEKKNEEFKEIDLFKKISNNKVIDNLVSKINKLEVKEDNQAQDEELHQSILTELDHLKEAQLKLWSVLHESQNLLSEFESLDNKNTN